MGHFFSLVSAALCVIQKKEIKLNRDIKAFSSSKTCFQKVKLALT